MLTTANFGVGRMLAPQGTRFAGYHPDSVAGGDIVVAGAQMQQPNTARLYAYLRHIEALQPFNNRTNFPLIMEREPDNPGHPNAIVLSFELTGSGKYKIGYVPRPLAQRLAPMLDEGHRFMATLNRIEPYRPQGSDVRHHKLTARIEYLSKPDEPPEMEMHSRVSSAFYEVMGQKDGWRRILTTVPEVIRKHRVSKQELIEKRDPERREVAFYLRGRVLTRVSIDPQKQVKPKYEQDHVPRAVKRKIARLLDRKA